MLFWICLVILLIASLICIDVIRSEGFIVRLAQRPFADQTWPSVSIVVSARNEQDSIDTAVRSLLNLDYPNYELTVVNDRSTDQTGHILKTLQMQFPRLNVVTISELPQGWLGKCNAMQAGAQRSQADWILFTDADVSMRPDTLKRVLDYVITEKADHISLVPECIMPNWLLHAFIATFSIFFKILVKPARIANPKSSAHCGIGAFNLIRSTVYQKLGGHVPIRLRPDDDLKLGKLVKSKGYAQRFASGIGLISVPWYPSIRALIHGLEKNSFAGMDYSLPKLLFSNLALPAVFVLPFPLLLVTGGAAWWMALGACVMILAMAMHNARSVGYPFFYGLFFPLGVLFFLYIINRAVLLTLHRKGIYWRDSFYSLKDLKANRI